MGNTDWGMGEREGEKCSSGGQQDAQGLVQGEVMN